MVRSFEVSGEGIYDEQTGEFMGGMVALKDVTEYTDKLAAQHEESEQQFQLICDTMPQLVSSEFSLESSIHANIKASSGLPPRKGCMIGSVRDGTTSPD